MSELSVSMINRQWTLKKARPETSVPFEYFQPHNKKIFYIFQTIFCVWTWTFIKMIFSKPSCKIFFHEHRWIVGYQKCFHGLFLFLNVMFVWSGCSNEQMYKSENLLSPQSTLSAVTQTHGKQTCCGWNPCNANLWLAFWRTSLQQPVWNHHRSSSELEKCREHLTVSLTIISWCPWSLFRLKQIWKQTLAKNI